MNIVQQATNTIALIVFEMVIVMKLWGWEEWKMIARMGDDGR